MATKNAVTLITELERRYLECNICTDLFDEDVRTPRLLPCHHPFCSECLKRLSRRKDQIKCPTCNSVHKVKKNCPIDFPKDNTRRDLTSFLQAHSDLNAFKKCCICGNTSDITYNCQHCNINLCEICRCPHEKENKTHNLIVNKPTTFREEDDNLDVCQNLHHERAKLRYFCNSSNCQIVLCPLCVIAEHRDISKHELEDIDEAFEKRKKELENDVESLRSRISHVESTIQNIVDNTSTFQNERDEFYRNLDAIFNTGINVLEEGRTRVLDRYNISFQMKNSKAVTKIYNLYIFVTNANECCSLSEQLINRNSKRSFFNVHQTVDAHMKRYLNTPVEKSTSGDNDSEETRIDFDDYLQSFGRNVEVLEKDVGNWFHEPLIEPAKESIQLDAGQQNETEDIRIHRDSRQLGRDDLMLNEFAYDQRHLGLDHFVKKQIYNCVAKVRNFLWQAIKWIIFAIVAHEIILIQLTLKEHGYLTGLKFDTQFESQFACRSADNQSVSTKPLVNMLCGSAGRLFKYEGVFANTSFVFGKESSIEFSIRFRRIVLPEQIENKFEEFKVFEFGLTEDSISRELLFQSRFSISAVNCQSIFGVCLKSGNGIDLKSEDILKSEPNSSVAEGQFVISYRPSDFTFSLLGKSPKYKTFRELYSAQFIRLGIPIWPVFAAYNSDKFDVSMRISTNDVAFDRYTMHQNLYISDDNKIISNKKLKGTFPSNCSRPHFIFTHPKNLKNHIVFKQR